MTPAPTLEEILHPRRTAREVEPHLVSTLAPEDAGAPYDTRAAAYDRMVSSRGYSRVAWGVPPDAHAAFVERALASRPTGWVLDVAAGSCVASAAAYARCDRPILVLDRSLGMLRRGRDRLVDLAGAVPPNVFFLQADAADLPLRNASVETVLCHGSFHVFDAPEAVCREWARALAPGGSLFVSSLVRGRWLGDRYLALLHRAGEVAAPRSAEAFRAAVTAHLCGEVHLETRGNFAYLSLPAVRPPPLRPARTEAADRYWRQFRAAQSAGAAAPADYRGAFGFGFTADDATAIAGLVRAGAKTATGSPLWAYQADGERVPEVGDHWIVVDGDRAPVCVIRTEAVEILPFDEVPEEWARSGGEGDRTLATWRPMYWRYIVSECGRIGREPDPKAPLVMERFAVVYDEPPAPRATADADPARREEDSP